MFPNGQELSSLAEYLPDIQKALGFKPSTVFVFYLFVLSFLGESITTLGDVLSI